MSATLLVILDDVVAGTLTRRAGSRLRFEYDTSYQEQSGHTPLSLTMPVQVSSHPDQQISPWLWGLLPDNDQVLRRWAQLPRVTLLGVLAAGDADRPGLCRGGAVRPA